MCKFHADKTNQESSVSMNPSPLPFRGAAPARRAARGIDAIVWLFAGIAVLFVLTGQLQSWNLSLSILNMCLLSAIMAMGVNMQWGYAGLFNTGVMGFTALGGLGVVLISAPAVPAQ